MMCSSLYIATHTLRNMEHAHAHFVICVSYILRDLLPIPRCSNVCVPFYYYYYYCVIVAVLAVSVDLHGCTICARQTGKQKRNPSGCGRFTF